MQKDRKEEENDSNKNNYLD